MLLAGQGEPAAAGLLDEALAAVPGSDPDDIGGVHMFVCIALLLMGDVAGSAAVADRGRAATLEAGAGRLFEPLFVVNEFDALYRLGRWQPAIERIDAAIESERDSALRPQLQLSAGILAATQDDPDGAARWLRLARNVPPGSTQDPQVRASMDWLNMELAVARGDLRQAQDIVKRDLEEPSHVLSYVIVRPLMYLAYVRGEADAMRPDTPRRVAAPVDGSVAVALRARLEALASSESPRPVLVAREAGAALATALAEDARRQEKHDPDAWTAAAAEWRVLGFPPLVSYCLYREGEAILLRRGLRTDAQSLISEARDLAEAIPDRRLQREIDALIGRARLDLPARAVAVPSTNGSPPTSVGGGHAEAKFGLTSREIEVLALLSRGLTNRQIAEDLFISPKTAGVHVSNILGKLGVARRLEAATIAHRLGLADPGPRTPA
jgi:DNA-binding CsgD family transcriptional regulator